MYGLIAKAPMRRMVKRNVVNMLAQLYTQREGAAPGDDQPSAESIPEPVMKLLRLKARISRLFRRPQA